MPSPILPAPRKPIPLRQVHLDFHTPGSVRPIARDFDAAAFARTMRESHVGSVNVFARCHHGFSYYPTDVGTIHPGLEFDLLGRQVEALHAEVIRAVAYVTIGWDDLAAENHPEWVIVGKDGALNARTPFTAPSIVGGLSPNDAGPNAARWSLLDPATAYGDYVVDQTRELCRRYDVDGFWFDICLAVPNYSPTGLARMRDAGIDASDDAAALAFARRSEIEYLERVARIVAEEKPGADVFFNGTTDAAMGELVHCQTHLDVESLPTSPGLWGYLHYPVTSRHARTYGLPFLGMTGRFHKSWADFGGLKTADQLEYEAGTIVAAGGGVFVGDQLHPRGVPDPAVYRLVGRVFERIERLEPWLLGARATAEVAIVSDPRTHMFGGQPATAENEEVEGAAQMFLESGVQFDVVDAGTDLRRYRAVVLPDGITVGPALRAALEAHLERGGSLLVSNTAGLGADGRFEVPGLPVEYGGPAPTLPAYFRVDHSLAGGSELATDYDYVLYDRATLVRARPGATAHGRLSAALFERTWEHFFSHAQAPVGDPLDAPLAVVGAAAEGGGRVAYLAAPLFRAYRNNDYWAYREVVRAALRVILPEPLVRFDGPPWVEVGLLRQPANSTHPERLVVHLVAYHPRRTMQEVPHVDGSWQTGPIRLAVRADALERPVGRCYLAPDGTAVAATTAGGYVSLGIESPGTHTVVVIEGTPAGPPAG
jgi:hypothetical protein